ncbi:MAG TPA: SDR family NAD(P)-dependent oxidoreductase [Acetobacteraceae bacterium]|jgi:NADP-dependent 3-hydroxy acid dehydrogenase YdfG
MKGQVALVTGASSDIGQAISKELLRIGASVFLLGRRRYRLTEIADAAPDRAEILEADLLCEGAVCQVFQAMARASRLDILVLGSGIYERSHDPEALARQFAANVLGPYSLLRGVLPLLRSAHGQIVFINSTQGISAAKDVGQFAATQHAMRIIADSIRQEMETSGVRVMTVFLGRTATERQKTIFELEHRPYRPDMLVQPQDVAHLVTGLLQLSRTAEVTEITLRPMQKT